MTTLHDRLHRIEEEMIRVAEAVRRLDAAPAPSTSAKRNVARRFNSAEGGLSTKSRLLAKHVTPDQLARLYAWLSLA